MKHWIIKLLQKLLIPMCVIMICYCLFRESLIQLPYVNILRYILLALSILLLVSSFITLLENTNKNKGKKHRILKLQNIYSIEYVVNYSFYIYFFIYLIFQLDRKSVLFNYLMLLIFGIYLGYRIARKAKEENFFSH